MKKNRVRVYLNCFDSVLINSLVLKLKNLAIDNNFKFLGPVFLPKKIEKFSILRSPHVNKDSRDKLQIITYKRIIDFFDVTSNFMIILRDCLFFFCLDFNFKFLF